MSLDCTWMMSALAKIAICVQIASLPKQNGARCRTVVITQGALPTVVASQGKVSTLILYGFIS